MSWDIFIFRATRLINNIDEIEEELLVDIGTWEDFKQLLLNQFPQATFDDNWCIIEDGNASLETSIGPPDEKVSNTIFHLYGAEAIYLLVALYQQNRWQAFDTSLDKMLDIDKPEENGYLNFLAYLTETKRNS
jgi:hypothetical protein